MGLCVCLVSGGTGGHLLPALALARALREQGHQPLLVTEGRDVEREILRRELPDVLEAELPRAGGKWSLPVWMAKATVAARRMLRERSVDCVVSTGGRPSLPVGLAARGLGKPLYLLEQNAVTGRVNRWLAPFATKTWHGLPPVKPLGRRAALTGTPLRPQFASIDRRASRDALGIPGDATVVLVTGGSQGAAALNEIVPAALCGLPLPVYVLHLAGLGRDDAVRRFYADGGEGRLVAHVRAVALDMDRLFGAADLVVCRGGGTTIAELIAAGRPAVVIPYPHHKDRQQRHNADVLVRAGAAIVIEESELEAGSLAELLRGLLLDRERLAAMGRAAASQRVPDPTGTILRDLREGLARGGRTERGEVGGLEGAASGGKR